jgi:hypothetical protein
MSAPEFSRLANELLAAHGRGASALASGVGDAGYEVLTLEVEGVKMFLCERPPSDRGPAAVLCADCGEIPPGMEADVMERVLAMNMLLYRESGATLCMDALSRHVVLLANVRPASASVAEVLDMARQFARGVREYEANHFGAGGAQLAADELFAMHQA